MRGLDEMPIDPDIEGRLEAIDATLAGEAVDPGYAEIAELTVLVAAERPRPSDSFVDALDARVARRFTPEPSGGGGRRRSWGRRRPWAFVAGGGFATAITAAITVVMIAGSGSTTRTPEPLTHAAASPAAAPPAAASAQSTGASSAGGAGAAFGEQSLAPTPTPEHAPPTPTAPKPMPRSVPLPPTTTTTTTTAAGGANLNLQSAGARALALPTNGRKVIQSAQLSLGAAPDQIDTVAQEVLDTVGAAGGIVDHSSVTQTGGSDGSAYFDLRIPSAAVPQTLSRLSKLHGAQVLSRTDNSQDVNGSYVSATRALADAQALRASLLKQLANATTSQQVASLQAQIHDAEATIAAKEGELRNLDSRINYSMVTVSISATSQPASASDGGGFTLGRAAHLAGRVLVVAAGVALIALAALVPVGLLTGILFWIGLAVRRRRREQALDAA